MAYFHSIFSFFIFLPPHESQSLLLPTSSLFFPTRLFFLCLHHIFSFSLSYSPFILFSFVCPPSLSPPLPSPSFLLFHLYYSFPIFLPSRCSYSQFVVPSVGTKQGTYTATTATLKYFCTHVGIGKLKYAIKINLITA